MPFDSSGNFYRTGGGGPGGTATGADIWKGDAAANIKILASSHDIHDQDLANGLSLGILRDGRGTPTANIPWGGKKITNLADPTANQDAATKHYVDNPAAAEHARAIHGADLDGRLNFTAATGVNGITWTYANLAWVARGFTTGEANQRLVLAPTVAPDTTGPAAGLTDVFIIDDAGRINTQAGRLTNNVSYEGATTRTISPGTGTILGFGSGVFSVSSNDTATITNNYASFTPRTFFTVQNSGSGAFVTLDKEKSGELARITGSTAGNARWIMDFGNATAESGTRAGSDFFLYGCANDGTSSIAAMSVSRLTNGATFYGNLATSGQFNFDSILQSSDTSCILAAASGGSIYFRPNGAGAATEEWRIDTAGNLQAQSGLTAAVGGVYAGKGIRGKGAGTAPNSGSAGTYGANWINFNWNGSVLTAYADTSTLGNVSFVCDYRIKKDIAPLPSTWDKVKKLNPIRYTQRAYDIWVEDDTPRWGFMAHELQEHLFEGAATGKKDGPDIQGPDLMAIIAGLTKALQEAMARIEALEAKA